MRVYLLIFIFVLATNEIAFSQILSQFSWDTNPVTAADIGPDAISVGSSATSSVNGSGGTQGLNAGLPKGNLNLTIPTSSGIFDVEGIDISIDYQRDESVGDFFTRGSSLRIRGGNRFSVDYRVEDGTGGFTTVSSGNVFNIPNDNTFRTYRFNYDPVTGIGMLTVNGVVEWSNDGPDGRGLYWGGAGNVVIGNALDGSGSNRAFLDNLIISEVTGTVLPIDLISFDATLNDQKVDLKWVTASEINNDFFTIQRSDDLNTWGNILFSEGAGNSSQIIEYFDVDYTPLPGTSYYRLKQTDFNGEFSYSNIVVIKYNKEISNNEGLSLFPNPVNEGGTVTVTFDGVNEGGMQLVLRDVAGREFYAKTIVNIDEKKFVGVPIDASIPSGIYLIIGTSNNKVYSEKLIIR